MAVKNTLLALVLALGATACASSTAVGGPQDSRPHKLKGPAIAAMDPVSLDDDGDLKQPVRSALATR